MVEMAQDTKTTTKTVEWTFPAPSVAVPDGIAEMAVTIFYAPGVGYGYYHYFADVWRGAPKTMGMTYANLMRALTDRLSFDVPVDVLGTLYNHWRDTFSIPDMLPMPSGMEKFFVQHFMGGATSVRFASYQTKYLSAQTILANLVLHGVVVVEHPEGYTGEKLWYGLTKKGIELVEYMKLVKT